MVACHLRVEQPRAEQNAGRSAAEVDETQLPHSSIKKIELNSPVLVVDMMVQL